MRVRNLKPNASTLISGVRFAPDPDGGGMVSEDISEERAAHFLAVPGYERERERVDEDAAQERGLPADLSGLSVADIRKLLVEQPHLADRVLADERAARGDGARKSVIDAVTAAKLSGDEQ